MTFIVAGLAIALPLALVWWVQLKHEKFRKGIDMAIAPSPSPTPTPSGTPTPPPTTHPQKPR